MAGISVVSSAKAVSNKSLVSQSIPEEATDGAAAIIGRIFLLPQVALRADDLTATLLNAISFIPSAHFFLGSAFLQGIRKSEE
jgi:hypothetical protein